MVDEASQATALQLAIAFDHCHKARRLVIVGDPAQLPPYSATDKINGTGCFTSAAAVCHAANVPHIALDTQFRLPADLSDHLSERVYDNKLKNGDNVKAYVELNAFQVPDGSDKPKGTCVWVKRTIDQWTDEGQTPIVLCFYDAQKQYLSSMLDSVKVLTVDEAQGQSYPSVIVVTTRSKSTAHNSNPVAVSISERWLISSPSTRGLLSLLRFRHKDSPWPLISVTVREEALHRLV